MLVLSVLNHNLKVRSDGVTLMGLGRLERSFKNVAPIRFVDSLKREIVQMPPRFSLLQNCDKELCCCLVSIALTRNCWYKTNLIMEKTESQGLGAVTPHQTGKEDGNEATIPSPISNIISATKQPSLGSTDSLDPAEKHEYLTGPKLLATMFSVSLVGFLMLLDTSIVSTVSQLSQDSCPRK